MGLPLRQKRMIPWASGAQLHLSLIHIYTQVSDVEDEVNGLFTYDRAAIKPDPAAVRAVNQALEAAFEKRCV